MLKRDITFESPFTGEKTTEIHYFHISKADLVEMEIEEHGNTYTSKDGQELTGMQAKLQRIGESEDGRQILAGFKEIIHRAYGIKDGERFRKSKEISDDFMSSEACSQLLFDIATNPELAGEFINNVIPSNIDEIAAEIQVQAEKVAAGREAQATARAAAGTPEGAIAQVADEAQEAGLDTSRVTQPEGATDDRGTQIAAATPEKPVTLTRVEVVEMDDGQLKAGIADGRYKFSQD